MENNNNINNTNNTNNTNSDNAVDNKDRVEQKLSMKEALGLVVDILNEDEEDNEDDEDVDENEDCCDFANEDGYKPAFSQFLHEVSTNQYEVSYNAAGTRTIKQGIRNELRLKGLEALLKDLEHLYADYFDVVRTREGIVIVAENEVNNFTFSFELKSTIRSVDYDPFLDANNYEESIKARELKRASDEKDREEKRKRLEEKLAEKLRKASNTENSNISNISNISVSDDGCDK